MQLDQIFRAVGRFIAAGTVAAMVAAPVFAQDAPLPPPTAAELTPTAAPVFGRDDGYVLGEYDVLQVTIAGPGGFAEQYQIQADGSVSVRYLGPVRAANLTVLQLRDQIAKRLRDGGYLVDPVVNIVVVGNASNFVTLIGEFATNGNLPLNREYRLSQILAQAGGVRPTASDTLTLRRATGELLTLNVLDVARGGPDQDPVVMPGDKIVIEPAPVFYIEGQVNAAGAYKIERGMTVRMALARAGGLTDRGSTGKLKVFRDGKQVPANLDMQLQGSDQIHVGERFF